MPLRLRGYDAGKVSDETGLDTGTDTITQQSFAEDADINVLVHRFGVTGNMPLGPQTPAIYGDFTGVTDFESARETIKRVNERFMSLPAEVRAKFENDPAKLIAFSQSVGYDEFLQTLEPVVVEPPAEPAA